MPQLYGTDEVRRQQTKLESAFALINGAGLDAELLSHYARYLCVRLAGFAEQSLKDLVSAHARTRSSAEVHRYVHARINHVWGINAMKLKDVLDELNPTWWPDLKSKHQQEIDSLQSVGKLRDSISHGGDQGVTMDTMKQYRDDVFGLYRALCALLDPKPPNV